MPAAMITGITGQDGSYLAELLLAHGYSVIGVVRQRPDARHGRLAHLLSKVELVVADLLDGAELRALVERHRPVEIYNLAGRASSKQLFDDPVSTAEYNAVAVVRLLEAVRQVDSRIRFCQASSSEIFGLCRESPQTEDTPFHPRNPYGVAKLCGHWYTVNYREAHGIFASSAILYNHESPRRGPEFVTRRISQAVARIKRGLQHDLRLGDLEARRDWGYAADYVRAMWQMLQAPVPDDFIIATGQAHSVREFCELAFRCVALNYEDYVVVDSTNRRPADAVQLVGDSHKARRVLGWTPTITFEELVTMMVEADCKALGSDGEIAP